PAQKSATGEPANARTSYRLLHDYLARVLVETPQPTLQRQRDAEDRIRFWVERDQTYFEATNAQPEPGLSSTGWFHSAFQHVKSFFRRVWVSGFAQPLPVLECLSLWRFAPNRDVRGVLLRSLRGFVCRVLVLTLIAVLSVTVWWMTRGEDVTSEVTQSW